VVNLDTVEFFPHTTPYPSVRLADFLHQAATDIILILSKPSKLSIPSLQAGEDLNNSILEIATLLKRIDIIPILIAIGDKSSPRVPAIVAKSSPRVSK